MNIKEIMSLDESKKWSGKVKEKWEPPEGFFTKSAGAIAKGLKADSKDLKQAMSRLNFYINRAGKNLSDEDHERLEMAKEKLRSLYEDYDLEQELDDLLTEGKAECHDMMKSHGFKMVKKDPDHLVPFEFEHKGSAWYSHPEHGTVAIDKNEVWTHAHHEEGRSAQGTSAVRLNSHLKKLIARKD